MALSPELRGAAAMVAATGVFVICDSFMKLAMDDLPPFEVLFMRGVAATLCGLGVVVALGQWGAIAGGLNRFVILRALGETVSVLCYIVALANMPIADVIAINQTAPLMLIIAAAIIWKDRIGPLRLVLVAMGFAGALLVAQPGTSGVSVYAMLAFMTALFIAVRDLIGRRIPPAVPVFVATVATNIIVMIGSAVMTTTTETWVAPNAMHILYLAIAGLFVTLGHVGVFLAYRMGAPRTVAPFFYSFAVWGVLAGLVVWGEIPNTLALFGIVLIVGSGVAIVLLDRRRAPAA